MNIFIGCLGLLISVVSIAALIQPGVLKAMVDLVKINTAFRLLAGTIRVVLGVALYMSAAATALPMFISVAGIVITAAGIILLVSPNRFMGEMLTLFTSTALRVRLVGIAGLMIGVLFAYAGLAAI